MATAKPDPETKRMTAVCLNCNGILYKNKYDVWRHDLTGLSICDSWEE